MLYLLDGFLKLDPGVVCCKVADAFGVDKNNALLAILDEPENDVGVEVACLKKDPIAGG